MSSTLAPKDGSLFGKWESTELSARKDQQQGQDRAPLTGGGGGAVLVPEGVSKNGFVDQAGHLVTYQSVKRYHGTVRLQQITVCPSSLEAIDFKRFTALICGLLNGNFEHPAPAL